MQSRSPELKRIIALVLAKSDEGIKYTRLVELVAPLIDEERATIYRMQRLKRKPSETAAQTIWEGQKAIARKYIDAAHRYGRVTYFDQPTDGERYVFPGDPAETGGRHSKPQKWTEEDSGISAV